MMELLDVGTTAATILGYPLSWIELVGTVFYLWSVALIAQRRMLTWPVGIVAVVLYGVLFWQIRLYSDAVEQLYYLGASVWGWWAWSRAGADRSQPVPVGYASRRSIVATAIGTAVGSLLWGAAMTRVHEWFPVLFPAPADYPWADAATTVMSLVAMWLLAQRRVESWVYWIIVDVVGVWLYWVKDVKFIALLYVVLLILATTGLVGWHRDRRGAAAAGGTA